MGLHRFLLGNEFVLLRVFADCFHHGKDFLFRWYRNHADRSEIDIHLYMKGLPC